MNSNFLRTASLELHALSDKDIVKQAAIAKRIINWLKGFGNPEFQKKLNELQAISPDIKALVDNLSVSIDKLNKALANTDPDGFGKAIETVKPLVTELSVKLENMEDTTQKVLESAPIEGIIDDNGKYVDISVTHLNKGWFKDKAQFEQMKELLPKDLDVPISRFINKSVKDFSWLQKFTPDNIRISDNAARWVLDAIYKVIYDTHTLDTEQLNNITRYIEDNKIFIINLLKENISNGILRSYTFPASGQPNKMSMVVDAGTIRIPGLGFDIIFPTVLLSDKSTSLTPIDEFELNSVKNIKAKKNQEVEHNVSADLIKLLLNQNNFNIAQSAKELGMSERTLRRKMQEYGISRPDNKETTASIKTAQANVDLWARNIIIKAFPKVMGREPTEAEIQTVQAVARLETYYGRGWKGAGVGSNNWGAIQCGDSCKINGQCDPAKSFPHKDSTPTDDGKTIWYVTCFKKYPTPEDGCADLIVTLFKSNRTSKKSLNNQNLTRAELLARAVQSRDLRAVSEAMYDTVYYEGTGSDRETRIQRHMQAMEKALNGINQNTGVQIALSNSPDKNVQTVSVDYNMENEVNSLLNYLYANGPVEKIVKKAIIESKLPKTNLLISISSDSDFVYNVKFAKLLSTALRVELCAENSIHSYKDKIEVESSVYGSEKNVTKAALAISDAIKETFKEELGVNVFVNAVNGVKSSYALMPLEKMESCFRKFDIQKYAGIR